MIYLHAELVHDFMCNFIENRIFLVKQNCFYTFNSIYNLKILMIMERFFIPTEFSSDNAEHRYQLRQTLSAMGYLVESEHCK